MADLFDYLKWRGDLPFTQVPPAPADALIFSILSYVRFQGIVPEAPWQPSSGSEEAGVETAARPWVPLPQAAEKVMAEPERTRSKQDIPLLHALCQTVRFRQVAVAYCQDVLLPEEQTQFAAITFFLPDGSAFLAFRGTDHTLVGWKEDFNMSFQDTVPAQQRALQYVRAFARRSAAPIRLAGHSKGGNLAVYAAAMCPEDVQARIVAIYNHDGPGFTSFLLNHPGYRRMVPKIHTYVPQSSVIGMLLEHEEPYAVVRSRQIGGVLQHEPYSWEIQGGSFVFLKETTADSQYIDRTLKAWLAGMDPAQRNAFIDCLFQLFSEAGTDYTNQIMQPRQILSYLRTLNADDAMRTQLANQLSKLFHAAWRTRGAPLGD